LTVAPLSGITPPVDQATKATLEAAIRDIPDFPEPGILFKDITPVLGDPKLFQMAIESMVAPYREQGISKIVGIDARGFIFAAAAARELDAGFVPVRKKGKLPWKTYGVAYSLEYGEAEVEIHTDAVHEGEKVLLLDDLLATGGTAAAAQKLLGQLGADLVGSSFLIELSFLNGREKLSPDSDIHTILSY